MPQYVWVFFLSRVDNKQVYKPNGVNKTVKAQAKTSLYNKPMVSPLQNSEAALSASDKELWIALQCICCVASNRVLPLSYLHKYKRASSLTEHLYISIVQELHTYYFT